MKLFSRLMLLCMLGFVMGCGGDSGGSEGDQNDPATTGTDEEQNKME